MDGKKKVATEIRYGELPEDMIGSKFLGAALLGDTKVTPAAKITGTPLGEKAPDRRQIAYLLPFEIVSIHLLVVLIGAAYLARAKRRRAQP
jgi:NADH-quinone oxidoreductase subunit J